jgi:hypothetical protein
VAYVGFEEGRLRERGHSETRYMEEGSRTNEEPQAGYREWALGRE